jgi:predicted kinase
MAPEELCRFRNRKRRRSVDDKVLTRQLHQSQFPYEDEAERVVFVDGFGQVVRDSLQGRQVTGKGEQ